MAESKEISPDKYTGCAKTATLGERGNPEKIYPLYWLAPCRDMGVRLVRMASLCRSAGMPVKHVKDSNIYHYPHSSRVVKYMLSLLGLGCEGHKEPAIRIVKINGKYFVERGHRSLLLAGVLKLDYVPVRIMEYSYELLKRNMQIFKYPDLEIVGIAAGQKNVYNYLGVSPENADVLLKHHRIPVVDHTVPPAGKLPGAPAPPGKRPRLAVVKKEKP